MDEIAESPQLVDFNLKMKLILIIGNHLELAGGSFSSNPLKCFGDLKAIRILISHRLNPEEELSLKKHEKVLEESLQIPYTIERLRFSKGGNIKDSPEANRLVTRMLFLKRESTLERYFEELMSYLNKYGFLLAEKQDETTSGFN